MTVLTGTVVNAETSRPLTGATVQVLGMNLEVESDSVGGFEASFEVDSTDTVEIVARGSGLTTDDFLPVLGVFNGFDCSLSSGEMFVPA